MSWRERHREEKDPIVICQRSAVSGHFAESARPLSPWAEGGRIEKNRFQS
jgi:hypothetical protein